MDRNAQFQSTGVSVLIVMAGLPGTGKSTLAARLAAELGGVVLSKDVVRAALFPGEAVDYSAEQDHIAITAVYSAAAYILTRTARPVFIDGRTFSKSGQLDAVRELAAAQDTELRVIECVCSDEIGHARIASDLATSAHLAGNRTPELYDHTRKTATPLTMPRLTLDTGVRSLEECVTWAKAYISG